MKGMASRLAAYFDKIRAAVGNGPRMKNFALYCAGLLSFQPRKTAESIAASAATTAKESAAVHQRLLHVIGQAVWDDAKVRATAEAYALSAMTEHEDVAQWIIDDTGLIKQGNCSVGVKRQYTGTAGKITNCQVATSLVVSTETTQTPVDFRIYLPREWTESPARRAMVKIPGDVVFRTKTELALDLVASAMRRQVPRGCVSADSAYGDSSSFRAELRRLHLDIALGIKGATSAWSVDATGRRRGPATSVKAIAQRLKYRNVTWRYGTKGAMVSRFGARRIVTRREYEDHGLVEPVWLLVERPSLPDASEKYVVLTASPHASIEALAYKWKERYRTERAYQDIKQNTGFDDYQGRSYLGWHHHATAVVVCAAFLVAEQSRRHSPRPKGPRQAFRTQDRFQRHFPDSFATTQRLVSQELNAWLEATFSAPASARIRRDMNSAA